MANYRFYFYTHKQILVNSNKILGVPLPHFNLRKVYGSRGCGNVQIQNECSG